MTLHGSDHRRGATQEDLGVAGSREPLLDVLLGDESRAALPVRGGVVEDVVDLEPVGEHSDEVVELDLEQDVVLVDVGVDEGELGRVAGVEEGVARDLEHGGYASAASDHAEFGGELGGVLELALGSLHLDGVANLEGRDVFGDVALLVSLRKEMLDNKQNSSAAAKYTP